MSAFAKAPRLPKSRVNPNVSQDDYIARAVRAFDAAAENRVFREPERETPTSLALTVAGALVFLLVVYVVWCGMYALLGGAR